MVVKKETTLWNLIGMALLPAIVACAIGFLNAMMPLILEDKDYYDIDESLLG